MCGKVEANNNSLKLAPASTNKADRYLTTATINKKKIYISTHTKETQEANSVKRFFFSLFLVSDDQLTGNAGK